MRRHRCYIHLLKLGQVSKPSLFMLFNLWGGRSAAGARTSRGLWEL